MLQTCGPAGEDSLSLEIGRKPLRDCFAEIVRRHSIQPESATGCLCTLQDESAQASGVFVCPTQQRKLTWNQHDGELVKRRFGAEPHIAIAASGCRGFEDFCVPVAE